MANTPRGSLTIGWYVHHQGSGHISRFIAVESQMAKLYPQVSLVGLGSLRPPNFKGQWIDLPLDDLPLPVGRDEGAGGALHWVPFLHSGMRKRSRTVADWIDSASCKLFVADVSIEMLLLGRLCSTPVATIAMRGDREDPIHTLGYKICHTIIAPWPEALDSKALNQWASKTVWVGGFSRFDSRIQEEVPDLSRPTSRPSVLLMIGNGGHEIHGEDVRSAIVATPEWDWKILGDVPVDWEAVLSDHPVEILGPRSDVWPSIMTAAVVVAPCGMGAVGEIAAARKPYVALPQARPFDEQMFQAHVLQKYDLAEVAWTWPDASDWPALLARALERPGVSWERYNDGRGAARLCESLVSIAEALPDLL